MRCYHFQNTYISGIHAGIQSAHVQHVFAKKYTINHHADQVAVNCYKEWALEHEVIIVLNGGEARDLLELESFIARGGDGYAWASFRESKDALNGSITNVGIVIPDKIYDSRHLAPYLSRVCDKNGNILVNKNSGDIVRFDTSISLCIRTIDDRCWIEIKDGSKSELLKLTSFEAALLQRVAGCRLM